MPSYGRSWGAFGDWRRSDEYKQYSIENEINQMDYNDCEPALPTTPAEVREQLGARQPSPPPPDDGDDPWGGGSADMYYEGWEDSVRRDLKQLREREAERAALAAAAAPASASLEPHPTDLRPGRSQPAAEPWLERMPGLMEWLEPA